MAGLRTGIRTVVDKEEALAVKTVYNKEGICCSREEGLGWKNFGNRNRSIVGCEGGEGCMCVCVCAFA